MAAPAPHVSPPPLSPAAVAGVAVFVAGIFAASLFLDPGGDSRLPPEEKDPVRLFEVRCAVCHGRSGTGQGTFPAIVGTKLTEHDIARRIAEGKGMMPAQRDLSREQREILAKYVKSFR